MGLLVIGSNAGGLVENIKDSETGWIIKKRSAKSIVNKICDILKMEPHVLDKIRENATIRVKEKFNIKDQSSLIKNFFNV